MWDAPIPMMLGGTLENRAEIFITVTTDQQDYELFTAAGEPSLPADVYLTVNPGVTIDTMTITGFAPGSIVYATFNGTARGRGGDGGQGGYAEGGGGGPVASSGLPGGAAGDAILVDGIQLRIDLDSGNAWGGGGGGGGGGGAVSASASAAAGGGGGGGQGWDVTTGGDVGFQATGINDGTSGTDGGPAGAGTGGLGSTPSGAASGGDGRGGGTWGVSGLSGLSGTSDGPVARVGGAGGAAGRGIRAINGATVVITGSKSESTLELEERLLGGILVV